MLPSAPPRAPPRRARRSIAPTKAVWVWSVEAQQRQRRLPSLVCREEVTGTNGANQRTWCQNQSPSPFAELADPSLSIIMKLFVAALLALSVDAFVVPAAQMRAVSRKGKGALYRDEL